MLLPSIIATAWGSGAEQGAMLACAEGDGEACRLAAEAFLSGDGVPVDFERAIELLGEACELGSGESCVTLAERYRDGLDVERAPALAAQWYVRGCEIGLGDACRAAGDLHQAGGFEGASAAEAERLHREGCDHLDAESCMKVVAALSGPDEPTPSEAGPFLELACAAGALQGCIEAAALVRDSRVALVLNERACELGDVPSCRRYGLGLLSGPQRDPGAGSRVLGSACEADDAVSCAALGDLLRKTDPAAALAAASRACGLGIDKSCRRAWKLRRKVER